MNILYTLNSGQIGGMEQHVLDLVSGMSSNEHNVYVWCADGPLVKDYEEAGAQVFIQRIRLDIDPVYIFKLFNFLRKQKIDVIHAHELKAVTNSLLAGFLAKTSVRISHTHTPISEWRISSLKKKINTGVNSFFVNKFSSKEIALTESRKEAKIEEGICSEKLEVIPNALDISDFEISSGKKQQYRDEITQRYDIPEGSYIFGNVSRISKEKGHDILVKGYKNFCEILDKRGIENNTFLFIGGGGVLEEQLHELVGELGLKDRVVITGKFYSEDHKKFYSTFDSFVFPSLAEGFGIVLIEAMAFSLPVLCSDLDVLKEVGGATVRYFEVGSAESLSLKMFDLYERRDQYYNFGEKAHERVEELYSMNAFIERYINLYRELSL